MMDKWWIKTPFLRSRSRASSLVATTWRKINCRKCEIRRLMGMSFSFPMKPMSWQFCLLCVVHGRACRHEATNHTVAQEHLRGRTQSQNFSDNNVRASLHGLYSGGVGPELVDGDVRTPSMPPETQCQRSNFSDPQPASYFQQQVAVSPSDLRTRSIVNEDEAERRSTSCDRVAGDEICKHHTLMTKLTNPEAARTVQAEILAVACPMDESPAVTGLPRPPFPSPRKHALRLSKRKGCIPFACNARCLSNIEGTTEPFFLPSHVSSVPF